MALKVRQAPGPISKIKCHVVAHDHKWRPLRNFGTNEKEHFCGLFYWGVCYTVTRITQIRDQLETLTG